jgi:diguanylate cyclase (GGDEF)-like protein
MGLLVVANVVSLAAHRGGPGTVMAGWPGLLSTWMAAVVCWLPVRRAGSRRWEVVLLAAAVTGQAVGFSYYGAVSVLGGAVPFPSPADVPLLLFYPLVMASLVVVVRNDMRGLASSVWLDSAVGSLGAASLLAVLLSPVLGPALAGSPSTTTAVAVAYPLSDLLLVAAVTGIAAVQGRRGGRRWVPLSVGLTVFAATDVVYALQRTAGTYGVGTPLDAGWAIGLAIMAISVNGIGRHDTSASQRPMGAVSGARAPVVSTAATLAAVAVLVVGTRTRISTTAAVLAGMTLLAASARTQLAFRRLARVALLRHRESTTDSLTGLTNRRALYAGAHTLLTEPTSRALLLLDLDKFKEINDSLGHHVGDLLLVEVGTRLRGQVHGGDLLARLGGDEFAVLLEGTDYARAMAAAVRLRGALAEPFDIAGIALHASVSIGIAVFPDDGPDLSSLLRKADIAMYKAKASGEGHHAYGSADDTDGATRLQTVEELRAAMTNDELVLHYQPKIDLPGGAVHGVEALVRWDHPTRGLLYPDAFLTLVEESGLMPTLTRLVLETALEQVATWWGQGQRLTVAVNLSASSLVDADLPDRIAAMLATRGVPACALQLEITEEFLMVDRDRARAILTRLRQHGIQISVDDFGTGYSSLGYLRDLPIDELKLDRSFVFPIADDARAAALVASTINLAHSLGLRMVAEGVETSVAYTELARLGCDQAQGYYMSRPVPAAELDYWLGQRARLDASVRLPGQTFVVG